MRKKGVLTTSGCGLIGSEVDVPSETGVEVAWSMTTTGRCSSPDRSAAGEIIL